MASLKVRIDTTFVLELTEEIEDMFAGGRGLPRTLVEEAQQFAMDCYDHCANDIWFKLECHANIIEVVPTERLLVLMGNIRAQRGVGFPYARA